MNHKPGIFGKIGAWLDSSLREYGAELLSLLSPGLLAWWFSVPTPARTPFHFLILAGAIVTGVFGLVIRRIGVPRRKELEDRLDTAEANAERSSRALVEVVQPIAHNLADHLELTNVSQRISIYCHYDGEFRILSREAKRGDYKQFRRVRYPDDQGVIGRIWRDGDKTFQLGKDQDWLNWTMDFGFTETEAEGLPMRSVSFCGVRLEHNRERVGVILLESTTKRGVNGTHLEKLQESKIVTSLAGLLYVAAPYFPEEPVGIDYIEAKLA